MVNAILIFAALCALVAVWKRHSVPAVALLASLATTSTLVIVGYGFNIAVWLLIDATVIVAITHQGRWWRDRRLAILILFLPSWVMYVVGGSLANTVSTLAVAAQLIITFPIRWFWSRAERTVREDTLESDFDLKVAGG